MKVNAPECQPVPGARANMLICATFDRKTAVWPQRLLFFPLLMKRDCLSLVPRVQNGSNLHFPPIWSAYILIKLFHARAVGGSVSPTGWFAERQLPCDDKLSLWFYVGVATTIFSISCHHDMHCVALSQNARGCFHASSKPCRSTNESTFSKASCRVTNLMPALRPRSAFSDPGAGLKTSRKNQFVTSSLWDLQGKMPV